MLTNLFSDPHQNSGGKLFRQLGTIQTPPVRPRTTIKSVEKFMIPRSRSVLEFEMTSCAARKPCNSVGLDVTNELDSRTRKVSQFIRPTRQSSALSRSRLSTREACKHETDKPKHPDNSRTRTSKKSLGKFLTMDGELYLSTNNTPETRLKRTNSVLSTKLDSCWSFGARSMPLPPLSRKTPAPPPGSPEMEFRNRSQEHVWSNLWHSGQSGSRSWQSWGNCANMNVCTFPGGWNEVFAKDLPTLHLLNVLGVNRGKPNNISSQNAQAPRASELGSTLGDVKRNTTRLEGTKSNSPQSMINEVPDLQVKQLTLEPGRSSTTEMIGRFKLGCTTNSTNRFDLDTVAESYPDPRTGATLEYLTRLGELLSLEETTKRYERIRWRRRFKKRTPSNGTISTAGDT